MRRLRELWVAFWDPYRGIRECEEKIHAWRMNQLDPTGELRKKLDA